MGTDEAIFLGPEQTEVSRLVSVARSQGEPDTFPGKRLGARYSLGIPLELTTDPDNPSAAWPVVMHNISGGGIGVWSKVGIPEKTCVYVRDRSDGASSVWLKAQTVHVTTGLQGYLIGAAFEQPLRPETGDSSDFDIHKRSTVSVGKNFDSFSIHSLRTKTALACAVMSSGVFGIAAVLGAYAWLHGWPTWLTFGGMAITFGLGGLVAWTILGNDMRFLKEFCVGVQEIAAGSPNATFHSKKPSKELNTLRHAFLDLGALWRKREDDQRLQRERLEELNLVRSNILSMVSHDLRTPLTSILLYAQMLKEELSTLSEADQRHFVEIISEECTRLSRLVDDLLEVQRLEAGRVQWEMTRHDLAATVHSSARLFEAMAESKSIRLGVECPNSLPPVEVDADRIAQVLTNLLSNALKYTASGGAVHLSARTEGKRIILSIRDNGPGIPRDQWDQIFGRFTQLSNANVREISGVGLGLYIVRKIVEGHRGLVWVDSEVGRGSEFFVSLPIEDEQTGPQEHFDSNSTAGRIVVCDADPELTARISQIFQWRNFDVRVAHSGCRLLAQLDQGETDVIITDVMLPDMSTRELLGALNALPKHSFKLIAHSYGGNGPTLRRRGVDIYLQRPASEDELIQAVGVTMSKRVARGKTVLLVGAHSNVVENLKRSLTGAGHWPLLAKTARTAKDLIRRYPIESVVLYCDSLTDGWANYQSFDISPEDRIPSIVLCGNVRKKDRQLAESNGVIVMEYSPEAPSELLEKIAASDRTLLPEGSQ